MSAKERYEEMKLEHELKYLMSDILGHSEADHSTEYEHTILPPTNIHDMLEYLENLSQHHNDLKNLP